MLINSMKFENIEHIFFQFRFHLITFNQFFRYIRDTITKMDKFYVIENESYDVNYTKIMKYVLKGENKLKFFFKKIFYYNNLKKNYVLHLHQKEIINTKSGEILNDKFSRKLFQAFTMVAQPYRGHPTFKFLECYDTCIHILENPRRTFGPIFVAKFVASLPNLYWETQIRSNFVGGQFKLENIHIIEQLKYRNIRKIHSSHEMTRFIEALGNDTATDINLRESKLRCQDRKIIDKLIFLISKTENKKKSKLT